MSSLFFMSHNVIANEQATLEKEKRIHQVESLFAENAEALDYTEVIKLSNDIILQREIYPNETLAKTYILLASVTKNKGELSTALQFILDGLAISTQDENTQLCLQIQLASILTEQKKYNELLTLSKQIIDITQDKKNINYLLFALSYQSVSLASQNKHNDALTQLHQVEAIIKQNPSFSDHITLLAIIANTYYQLGDYQTALTMQLRILTLRFNLNKLANIDQTYYQLANTYYRLNQLDDAYNAYWEAKIYAKKKGSPIYVAFAKQGLARTLIRQKQFDKAINELIKAQSGFYQHNLITPYLETTTSLAQLHNLTGHDNEAERLLLEAESVSKNVELTDDYIIFYQLLANIYQKKNDLKKAYSWQQKYVNSVLKYRKTTTPDQSILTKHDVSVDNLVDKVTDNQSNQPTMKLAERSELASVFSNKYHQQQVIIVILLVSILLLISGIIFLWLKQRAFRLKSSYEALEKSNNFVANPIQTKQLYQRSFNMARKYSYPLTLSYISISNWQELTFQFNKKIVAEVALEITELINKSMHDFENAGLINDGEYLLLFPHQSKEEVTQKIEGLVSALKLRFFANLGSFSVTIAYAIDSPNYQDIDPYVYLSQLSGSIELT